jgi:hypothetical protein
VDAAAADSLVGGSAMACMKQNVEYKVSQKTSAGADGQLCTASSTAAIPNGATALYVT